MIEIKVTGEVTIIIHDDKVKVITDDKEDNPYVGKDGLVSYKNVRDEA